MTTTRVMNIIKKGIRVQIKKLSKSTDIVMYPVHFFPAHNVCNSYFNNNLNC